MTKIIFFTSNFDCDILGINGGIMNSFILALFLSIFGLGYVMYGRKAQRSVFWISGIALMVYPYFVSDLLWMSILGIVFLALPFVVRR